jgi:hypothetical protein
LAVGLAVRPPFCFPYAAQRFSSVLTFFGQALCQIDRPIISWSGPRPVFSAHGGELLQDSAKTTSEVQCSGRRPAAPSVVVLVISDFLSRKSAVRQARGDLPEVTFRKRRISSRERPSRRKVTVEFGLRVVCCEEDTRAETGYGRFSGASYSAATFQKVARYVPGSCSTKKTSSPKYS